MTLAVSKWGGKSTDEIGPMRGEKGSASPPRRRWKEMAGDNSEFTNGWYPVDTMDIRHFLICS